LRACQTKEEEMWDEGEKVEGKRIREELKLISSTEMGEEREKAKKFCGGKRFCFSHSVKC